MAGKKITQEQFIKKCIHTHKNKYNLSKVVYTLSKNKIIVICPMHGEWLVEANSFASGSGCPHCRKTNVITQEQYIERCKKIHGDRYDLSKVVYIHSHKKITATCPVHGDFLIQASHFSEGKGCQKCIYPYIYDTASYIEAAKKIHGDRYDYSLVDYTHARKYTSIVCPKEGHGEFRVQFSRHISGSGCPKCCSSYGERIINTWLTDNNVLFEQQVRFTDCADQLQLPFDFCIYNKDGTIKTILEYDGEQHYKPYRRNDQKALTLTQYHDAIKNQYCEDHKIPLIRIPYWDMNNIPEILQKHIGDSV